MVNFRLSSKIVEFLNRIRPDLPQQSAIDGFEGEVIVINCDDYIGVRRNDHNFKNELPTKELKERLDKLIRHIKNNTPNEESFKILMITHKVLATQQGHDQLLGILSDKLRDKQDPFFVVFYEYDRTGI